MATKGWCTGLARAQGVSAAGAGILDVGPVLAHGVRPVERPAVRHSCALAGGLSASSKSAGVGGGMADESRHFFSRCQKARELMLGRLLHVVACATVPFFSIYSVTNI